MVLVLIDVERVTLLPISRGSPSLFHRLNAETLVFRDLSYRGSLTPRKT
jgi:hypothetical protein